MMTPISKTSLVSELTHAARFSSSAKRGVDGQGVFFRFEGDMLHVLGMGDVRTYVSRIKLTSPTPGSKQFSTDHRKLLEYLALLPSDTVEFTLKDTRIEISTPKAKATFPLTYTEVEVPQDTDISYGIAARPSLSQALDLLSFSAAQDSSRPILTCIKLVPQSDKKISLVATDGFRLSIVTTSLLTEVAGPIQIPANFLRDALAVCEDERVSLSTNKDQTTLTLTSDTRAISTRLITGDFPPYERVLVTSHKDSLVFDKKTLNQAVKTISVFARDLSNIVVLDLSPDKIRLSPRKEVGVENYVDIEPIALHLTTPMRLSFNHKYLTDFLASVDDEHVTIRINRSDAPVLFLPGEVAQDASIEGAYYQHIIMPVRSQE